MSSPPALIPTLFTALLGAHLTYWLTHRKKMNVIRAASLSSLTFIMIANILGSPILLSLRPAFFGSTFVAMSEPSRLSEKKVLCASIVFGIILYELQKVDFVHYRGGIGGTLGGTAFLACILVYWIQSICVALTRFFRVDVSLQGRTSEGEFRENR